MASSSRSSGGAAGGSAGSVDVVVVGAGLAGLSAAVHLTRAGFEVLAVEAAAEPGGRIRTDCHDGFRLDRGFQVFNPAYPEPRRLLDLDALELRSLTPGAPPQPLRRPVRVGSGLYVCGDHRDTASIQGAMVSGRRAAQAVVADTERER